MTTFLISFVIVILVCIFWTWNMLGNHPKLKSELYDNLSFKTGDIILFHAYDNINPVFIGSYWGHIGVVYNDIDDDNPPLLFEAARTSSMKYCPEYNKSGIMITDLKTRLEKYPGLIACKFLKTPIDDDKIRNFKDFMKYAKTNMYYHDNVIESGINKLFGEKLHNGTNCGEITTLSLIKLGLLNKSVLDKNICHHLKYTANIKNVNDNEYSNPIELLFNRF